MEQAESGSNAPRLRWEDMPAAYGFIPSLNGLRAASILLVVIGHFALPERFNGVSALGVFLFFAISGFLITRLLFAEDKKFGSISLKGFFYRRYLRLYPVLIFYLIFFLIIFHIRGDHYNIMEIFSVLFYFTNYLHNFYEWRGESLILPIGALWSLAVEEHFYFLMPFAFLFVRGNPRKVMWFAIAFCIAPLMFRFAYVLIWPEIIGTEYVYRPSETRFDSIAIGVLIAALCELPEGRRFLQRFANMWGLVAGVLLLLGAFAYKGGIYGDTLRYSARNIGCGLILVAMVFGTGIGFFQRIANWPVIDGVGRLSYSLYIWQGGIFLLLGYAGLHRDAFGGWLAIGGSFVLAVLSYKLIEQPTLRFKDLGRRAQPAVSG